MSGGMRCLKSDSDYLKCWNTTLVFFFKFTYKHLSCVRYLLCYRVHRRNLPLRGEIFIHIVGRLNLSIEHLSHSGMTQIVKHTEIWNQQENNKQVNITLHYLTLTCPHQKKTNTKQTKPNPNLLGLIANK